MSTTAVKPHISPSQLESYCRCPEAYRRRYLDGQVIPPGIAQMKGTGFHRGAELNMRQKLESHRDLPTSDIVDCAIASFAENVKVGCELTADERSRGKDIVVGEAVDALRTMATVHAEKQAPEYQPVLIEEKVRIELPNAPRDLLGIIDLADDKQRVVDFKTGGKKKTQNDADDSVQLTVYAAAYHARTGRPPSELRLDTVVQTKTKTFSQVVSTTRGEPDFSALANRINAVTKSIEAGSFPPATPQSWWCSDRYCGYHSTCPYVNSERKSAAQDD